MRCPHFDGVDRIRYNIDNGSRVHGGAGGFVLGVQRHLLLILFCALLIGAGLAFASHASAWPTAGPTPTPTPSAVPVPRHYDPPAPPDLPLAPGGQSLQDLLPGGYPRIVKLWGGYDPQVGLDFYTRYHMIVSEAFTTGQLAYLRAQNPSLILLYSGIATYDLDTGPLGSRWVGAPPGTPEFECFYRGVDGAVLRVGFWGHGMFNVENTWCRTEIVNYLISQFDPALYQGVFFDRITQVITPWIIDGIDRDHDGLVDDRDAVNDAYGRGTQMLLDSVRQHLGVQMILVANDAPLLYTTRLNGREYESFVRQVLDGGLDWTQFRYNYEQWARAARDPRLTMVMANPPSWMLSKYGIQPYVTMKPAAVDEAAAHYQRMRFGLTTALLDNGLYSFEFGDTWHGNAWWYDEFDGGGLGLGYLGQPLGEAYHAAGPLLTPNQVVNPSFESAALSPWTLFTYDAQATLETVSADTDLAGERMGQVTIRSTWGRDGVRLSQGGLSLVGGRSYTLSFRARATQQLWNVRMMVHPAPQPWSACGLDALQEIGTAWQQYWVPFTASATVSDAVLSLSVGQDIGRVWIDDVRLQEGILPDVWRRDFEHGIVLCNATTSRQSVSLDGVYTRLAGQQAPRVKILIDDTAEPTSTFARIGGWTGHVAGMDEWGDSWHHAVTTQDPGGWISSAVWRPDIPYAGDYTVSVWLAPHSECNAPVTYMVQHAAGVSFVAVNPVVGEPGWAELGTYPFAAGTGGTVALPNLTTATWAVADAVKFESAARYNDGATVAAVTLEGQDGIILLGDPRNNGLPYSSYLPLILRDASR